MKKSKLLFCFFTFVFIIIFSSYSLCNNEYNTKYIPCEYHLIEPGNLLNQLDNSTIANAKSKPVILSQPKDTTVCNGEKAIFYVIAEGEGPLSYAWEVSERGTGWLPIEDNAIYENSTTDTLIIKAASLSMHKFKYRVTITDESGDFRISNAQATLYVTDGATVTASPQADTLCNGETAYISLTSDIPGTKYTVEVLHGEIYGANTSMANDSTIQQVLTNNTLYADYAAYKISPLLTSGKLCEGIADTVVIWINPTPGVQVSVFKDTICNDTYTAISLTSENILTTGEVSFKYTSFADEGITGNSSETYITNGFIIADTLHNSTHLPAYPLTVRYSITPQALSTGCSDGQEITCSFIVHPTPDIEFAVENASCYSDSNGTATVYAQNGVNIFSYEWDDLRNQKTKTATNLNAGMYTVSITDNQFCISVDSIKITQPDPLLAEAEINHISCFGANDGSIAVRASGGTPYYTYQWADGYTEALQSMMPPGNYMLKITDQNGCFIDTIFYVTEPGLLTVNPTIRYPTCYDMKDGYIELNISGGRTPYDVYWDNGQTGENLINIKSGIYNVVVYDSSMCSIDTTFKITGIFEICFQVPNAFTPNGDSYNEKWVIDMKGLYPAAEIEVFDRSGKRVFYSKGYDESKYWDGTYKGEKLPMDTYYYIINLKNGTKRISGTITLLR